MPVVDVGNGHKVHLGVDALIDVDESREQHVHEGGTTEARHGFHHAALTDY